MDLVVCVPLELWYGVGEYLNLVDSCRLSSTCKSLNFDVISSVDKRVVIRRLEDCGFCITNVLINCIEENDLVSFEIVFGCVSDNGRYELLRKMTDMIHDYDSYTNQELILWMKSRRTLNCEITGNVGTYVYFLIKLHELFTERYGKICHDNLGDMRDHGLHHWISLFITTTLKLWSINRDFVDLLYAKLSDKECLLISLLNNHYHAYTVDGCERSALIRMINKEDRVIVDVLVNSKFILPLIGSDMIEGGVFKPVSVKEQRFFDLVIENDSYTAVYPIINDHLVQGPTEYCMITRLKQSGDTRVLDAHIQYCKDNNIQHNICRLAEAIRNKHSICIHPSLGSMIAVPRVISNCRLCDIQIPKIAEM